MQRIILGRDGDEKEALVAKAAVKTGGALGMETGGEIFSESVGVSLKEMVCEKTLRTHWLRPRGRHGQDPSTLHLSMR